MTDHQTSAQKDKIPLSVIIITRNEAENIAECIASICWAEEIIVVDAQSTDDTAAIAKRFTDRVCITEWLGYSGAKNYALEKASKPWVLWLDADERVPEELAGEIREIVLSQSTPHTTYEVARRAYFLGKWIQHCGWYPGYVVRLFRRQGARFNDSSVHEKLIYGSQDASSTTGRLKNDMLHFTDRNLAHYFAKFNSYTSLAADELAAKGRSAGAYDLLIRPPFMFFKMYFLRLGFLDGIHGFILCVLSSLYVFTKYAKLFEHRLKNGNIAD